uniref:Uncharacterized protein n=1 Tax=Homalodisca liturata TaxID=320908 RepID=A0A1B6HRB0_9HEMI
MQPWWLLSLRIGAFGFLKEFRPEDPYITQYLVGPIMNLTEHQVNQEVYPIATYIGLIQIVFVFLLTDFLCYKPVIVMNALSGVISQGILIWGRGLRAMQVMEIFYATMTACEVAYYTYIYAKVDKNHYQTVTSHMRAAALTGRFTSATTSQIMLSLGILTIADLNHLTFVGMCCALLCALTLPSMDYSLYFHRKSVQHPIEQKVVAELPQNKENCSEESSRLNQNHNSYTNTHSENGGDSQCVKKILPDFPTSVQKDDTALATAPTSKWKQVVQLLWMDFRDAYTNPYVFKMCVFISLATCGYNQMMTYVQILWVKIGGKQQEAFNGGVEAIYTIISAVSALAFGQVKGDWSRYGEAVIGLLSVLQGALLLLSSFTDSMVIAYTVYVVFGMLYNVMMVLTNSEVARHLNQDSYALIFGMNSFVALILQTILTFAVAGLGGLTIPIRHQFVVYGGYFAVLGGVYTIKSCFTMWSYYHLDHLLS